MNKTRLFLVLAISSALLGIGRGNANVTSTNGANANSGSNADSATAQANAAPATNGVVAAESAPAGTPTASYLAAFNARNSKDIEGLKKLMSKDVLEFFAEMQKAQNQTLDDALRELCESPQAPKAEVRNEKIEGETASLEYKDETGGWQRMDFIKEDGMWKLTIPKAEMRETKPPTNQKAG